MLGAAFGVGFVVGPLIGAVAGQFGGPRLPFWIAGGMSLLNALWGLFVLPESLPKEKREPFSFKRANPVGSLVLLSRKPQLLGLAAVNFLYMLAHVVLPSTFVLYAHYRYGWGALGVGLTLVAVGISSIVVQALLIKPLVARFGERTLLVAGLLFGVACFAIYGLAPTGALFWLGIPLGALWGLAGASAQSLMTRYVGPSEQGQLQGARSSINGIAEMIAPPIFTFVFATFISKNAPLELPGAPFLLAGCILALCALLAAWVTRPAAMPASPPVTRDPATEGQDARSAG